MKESRAPSFRYVPAALLGQLAALQATAADLARTVTEVRGGAAAPPEPIAAFGAATGRVALSAAPLLDKYKKTLTAGVPFSGEDLCSDEAAMRAAADLQAVAEFMIAQAAELVAFYRARLGERTRDVVSLLQHHLDNPFLDAKLRPGLAADCRPVFSHIEARNEASGQARRKNAGLREALDETTARAEELAEENEALRTGAPAALRATDPAAAPKKRARPRRR